MLRPMYDRKIRRIADKSLTNHAIDLRSSGWSDEQIWSQQGRRSCSRLGTYDYKSQEVANRSYIIERRVEQGVTTRFVTRFNLWLRHNLWPQNASICDPARFVTKSASNCHQRYTMILDCKLCREKLVFVFTLIMHTEWYDVMHIYMNYDIILIQMVEREVWCCFTLILFEYYAWYTHHISNMCIIFYASFVI